MRTKRRKAFSKQGPQSQTRREGIIQDALRASGGAPKALSVDKKRKGISPGGEKSRKRSEGGRMFQSNKGAVFPEEEKDLTRDLNNNGGGE